MKIDPALPATLALGRIDAARVDATAEVNLAAQKVADESQSMQDAAKFTRLVRKRLGLRQPSFHGGLIFASGSRGSAAQQLPPRPCSRCWTGRPKRRWQPLANRGERQRIGWVPANAPVFDTN